MENKYVDKTLRYRGTKPSCFCRARVGTRVLPACIPYLKHILALFCRVFEPYSDGPGPSTFALVRPTTARKNRLFILELFFAPVGACRLSFRLFLFFISLVFSTFSGQARRGVPACSLGLLRFGCRC